MNEVRVQITVSYDWDRITAVDIERVVLALPGVVNAETVLATEPATSEVRWRVQNNITGEPASQPYDTKETVEHICRGLNTPEAGGLWGVYTNESGTWRRDLE